jgi:predicted Zn-dependent protease
MAHTTPSLSAAADVTSVAPPVRARWERPHDRPVRVFFQSARSAKGWTPELADQVWSSFRQWTTTDLPVRFARVSKASSADVIVEWVDSLPGNCIGKTWREDVGGQINAARITLALRDKAGRSLSPELQRGAALHEVGHLLGLEHVGQRASIMYPQVWVSDVSTADRRALRDLYGARSHSLTD